MPQLREQECVGRTKRTFFSAEIERKSRSRNAIILELEEKKNLIAKLVIRKLDIQAPSHVARSGDRQHEAGQQRAASVSLLACLS